MSNHNLSYYSIDRLKMEVYRGDENCGFTPIDSNELIGNKLWSTIRDVISTSIENKQDLIIEGAYIFPEYLSDFDSECLNQILPIFICFSEKYIRENYETGILKYRHAEETRIYEEERSSEIFIQDHMTLMSKCEKNEVEYFAIDENYEEEMEKIYKIIKKSLE